MKPPIPHKRASMAGLKIAYDGKRAVCNHTGIGNYSRCLVDALSTAYPDNTYMLFSPKLRDNPQLAPLLRRDNVSLVTPDGAWKHFGGIWRSLEMTRLMMARDVSLVHGLSNELPLNIDRSGLPSIVTIHDLIWRRIPENYSPVDRWLFDMKYKASAEKATRIIAISQRTKADIIEDFGIDASKIDVVYQGCSPLFAQQRDPEIAARIRQTYNLPDTYIIAVGTVEVRKNQLQAVKALRGLPPEVKLVIVGRRHKGYGHKIDSYIASHRLADRVIWLENVPTEHLPYLYGGARLASYTSRYEGFGLPVIEALSAGTPVIGATGSCLEEAGGPGAIYVSPDDVDQYIDAASTLIADNYQYHKYADNGKRYIRKFNAADFAHQTMAAYGKAIIDSLQ